MGLDWAYEGYSGHQVTLLCPPIVHSCPAPGEGPLVSI